MDQSELLRYVIDVLEDLRIPYMVVGSLASRVPEDIIISKMLY